MITVITLVISILIGFKIYHYGEFGKNILGFPIGMIVAKKIKTVEIGIRKSNINRLLLMLAMVFTISYSYYTIIKWHIAMADNLFVNYIVDTICQISFIALMLVFVQKYNIKSRVSIAIASISYEVYLTHQLGLDAAKFLFGNTFDAIIIFIGIVISLIMGYVLNKALFIIWVRRK